MDESPEQRRRANGARAWGAHSIGAEHSAPALAISPPPFAVDFAVVSSDAPHISRLNFGTMAQRATYTTWFPLTLTIEVVALDDEPDEREFAVVPTYGSIGGRIYSPHDHTTTFTWTIPAGRVLTPSGTEASETAIELEWTTAPGRRSKVVVTAITAGEVVGRGALTAGWTALPIDSAVVGDASPVTDGTY